MKNRRVLQLKSRIANTSTVAGYQCMGNGVRREKSFLLVALSQRRRAENKGLPQKPRSQLTGPRANIESKTVQETVFRLLSARQ